MIHYSDGSDFLEVTATVVFPPGSENNDTECFDVTIVDNMAFEKREYFWLHIIAVEEGVMIHITAVSFHIIDNDGKGHDSLTTVNVR